MPEQTTDQATTDQTTLDQTTTDAATAETLQSVLKSLQALRDGDFSQRMRPGQPGIAGEIATTFNEVMDLLNVQNAEVTRISREIGSEGRFGGQAEVPAARGGWRHMVTNLNCAASNLTDQVRDIAFIITAFANGDFSRKMTVPCAGETEELKATINVMVDQLNCFAGEATRIAREVGTEGIFGGQMDVRGISGSWKDLTDNINFMAANLTFQVRVMNKALATAAEGDYTKKAEVKARGETQELIEAVDTHIDRLAAAS